LGEDDPLIIPRWRNALSWLYHASNAAQQALSQLNIKVITSKGTPRRANNCYLGPDYSKGQLVWRLYNQFGDDEFVGNPSDNGLGDIPIAEVENFLLAIGVNDNPRLIQFESGDAYIKFREYVIDHFDYPKVVSGQSCATPGDVRRICHTYEIEGLFLPDRWIQLLTEGDSVSVIAY
jgi:hypothetical protein